MTHGDAHRPVLTVGRLAERLGATVQGDPETVIRGIAGIREAVSGDLSFITHPRYASDCAHSSASVLLCASGFDGEGPGVRIQVGDVEAALPQVLELFRVPAPPAPEGIHPSAVVAEDAFLGEGVSIGPHGVVESDAHVGAGTVLLAGAYVGHGARVGEDCLLYQNCCVREYVTVGDRAILHCGCIIGSDGYGYDVGMVDGRPEITKIPQTGTVILGDDVEIGSNTTIDRARFGATRLGDHVKIDNLCQIAHNVVIEERSGMAGQAGIAGSTKVERYTMIQGQAGLVGHIVIGEGSWIGGTAMVTKSLPPGSKVSGSPARDHAEALARDAGVSRVAGMRKRIADLTKRIEDLESGGTDAGADAP